MRVMLLGMHRKEAFTEGPGIDERKNISHEQICRILGRPPVSVSSYNTSTCLAVLNHYLSRPEVIRLAGVERVGELVLYYLEVQE